MFVILLLICCFLISPILVNSAQWMKCVYDSTVFNATLKNVSRVVFSALHRIEVITVPSLRATFVSKDLYLIGLIKCLRTIIRI